MAATTSKADALAKRLADHGRHIFIYNHLWTGQTIYSLDRSLNNTLIKQLPFAGKKTIPSGIRKDVWRPLLTVSFPTQPQGLHAFRKLREYKKLHELSWSGPTVPNNGLLDLSNPYVHNETPRPPKKERSRLIMDQKANTIADLAAVLREQEETGAQKLRNEAERKEAEEKRVRDEMVTLAEQIRNGAIPPLQEAIQAQELALADIQAKRKSGEPGSPTRREVDAQHRALKDLKRQLKKMQAVKETFENGQARLIKQAQAESESGAAPSQLELDVDPPSVLYRPDPINLTGPVPKRGPMRKIVAHARAPTWSADGVKIRWSNPLDAEIAEAWPAAVEHHDAGLLRHIAPAPDADAVFDVEMMLRSPKALEELDFDAEEDQDSLEVLANSSSDKFMEEQPRA